MKTYAYHVTPSSNIKSIMKTGLEPRMPEEGGDMAVSLFKTLKDANIQTNLWLGKKCNQVELSLLKIEITGLNLTETFPFELITTCLEPIHPDRIVKVLILKPQKFKIKIR